MEVFKDIDGYEGLYQVSDLGRVRSVDRIDAANRKLKGRHLKQNLSSSGYLRVGLRSNKYQKIYWTHQLVAMAFLGHKPNGHELVVHHENNIKTDNRADNLRLITQRQNTYTHHKGASKYKGVSWAKDRSQWRAAITVNGRQISLGSYDLEIDAHNAYNNYCIKNKII